MKVNGLMIKLMEKEISIDITVINTKEIGFRTKCMDMVGLHSLMGIIMKVNG